MLTFCNYGGKLRELKFEVCECTVYVDNRVPKPERTIGFVRPGETARPRITVIRDRLVKQQNRSGNRAAAE